MCDDDAMVTVTRSDVAIWERDQAKLRALQAAGVDNWSGYDHAMSILHGEED